jgi:hypothetical protein
MHSDSPLLKRFKSFLWRVGMMVIAAAISIMSDELGMLELSPAAVTVLGLVLGEVSKAINSKLAA